MLEFLVLFALGIFLLYVSIKVSEKTCPPRQIIYRFVPRTLKEEMENPVKIDDIFGTMFSGPNVYVGGVTLDPIKVIPPPSTPKT